MAETPLPKTHQRLSDTLRALNNFVGEFTLCTDGQTSLSIEDTLSQGLESIESEVETARLDLLIAGETASMNQKSLESYKASMQTQSGQDDIPAQEKLARLERNLYRSTSPRDAADKFHKEMVEIRDIIKLAMEGSETAQQYALAYLRRTEGLKEIRRIDALRELTSHSSEKARLAFEERAMDAQRAYDAAERDLQRLDTEFNKTKRSTGEEKAE